MSESLEGPNDNPAPSPSYDGPSNPFQDEVNASRDNNHHHLIPFPQGGEFVPPVSSMNISPPGRVSGTELPQVEIVDNQQQQTLRMGSGSDSSYPGPWTNARRNPPETTLSVSGGAVITPTIQLGKPGKK